MKASNENVAVLTPFVMTLVFGNAIAAACALPWVAICSSATAREKKRTQLLTQAWPLPTDFPGRAGELADLQHRWTEQEGL